MVNCAISTAQICGVLNNVRDNEAIDVRARLEGRLGHIVSIKTIISSIDQLSQALNIEKLQSHLKT